MARSSVMIGAEIAMVEASNKSNQNGINKCNATMQDLQDRINDLNAKKSVLESTYSIYFDLKEYIVRHLASLEETSVCITEIKTEADEQISGKIDSTLKVIETLTNNLKQAIGSAQSEYNTAYLEKQTYENNLGKGQQQLGTLSTELEEAKAQELPQM